MKKPIARVNSAASIKKVIDTTKDILNNGAAVDRCHISAGNVKLDGIKNISLPPVVTCGANCKECKSYCYAVKSFNRLPVVAKAWSDNYKLYRSDPQRFFADIQNATKKERVFRWHVSGDIVDANYFAGMVEVAQNNKDCSYLAFTKQYSAVNAAINGGVIIPDNLHIIYSASPLVDMDNPHRLPECHINFADHEKNTYKPDQFNYTYNCTGNCKECVINGCGCFFLKNGDAVTINQH